MNMKKYDFTWGGDVMGRKEFHNFTSEWDFMGGKKFHNSFSGHEEIS